MNSNDRLSSVHSHPTRSSGIELMRVICMISIVMGHYVTHGGVLSSLTVETMSSAGVFLQLFGMGNRIACSMFAMITGYFKIASHSDRHYLRIIPLIAEMFFYSVLLYFVTPIQYRMGSSIAFVFLPIFFGNWFVVYYIILYICIPAINPILNKLNHSEFSSLVTVLLVVWSIIPTFSGRLWQFSSFDFFLIMYCLGAYLRLYVVEEQTYSNVRNLLSGFLFLILIGVSIVMLDALALISHNNAILSHARYFMEYSSILAVPCSVFFFLYFARLDIESNIVNCIAKSSLGILLIHDNIAFRNLIWIGLSPNPNYASFPYIHAVFKSIIVYFVCLCIDLLRRGSIGWYIECLVNDAIDIKHIARPCERLDVALFVRKALGLCCHNE